MVHATDTVDYWCQFEKNLSENAKKLLKCCKKVSMLGQGGKVGVSSLHLHFILQILQRLQVPFITSSLCHYDRILADNHSSNVTVKIPL